MKLIEQHKKLLLAALLFAILSYLLFSESLEELFTTPTVVPATLNVSPSEDFYEMFRPTLYQWGGSIQNAAYEPCESPVWKDMLYPWKSVKLMM